MTDEQTTDAAEATAYTKAEQAHYEAIRKKEREVGIFAIKADDTKRTASAAKKTFEVADEELRKLIRGGPDLQQQLPGMDDVEPSEEWRDLSLTDLGLDAALAATLHKSEITTIGELSDYMAEHGPQWSGDLMGIGEVKAEVIQECYVTFWAAHPEYCEASAGDESTSGRIQIKILCEVINENDDTLAAAGKTISAATDSHGKPYLVDPADGERVYLEPEDYKVVG